MIEELIEKIKRTNISLFAWFSSFSAIVLIRFFLESLFSPSRPGDLSLDLYAISHFWILFFCIAVGFMLIIGSLTKDYRGTSKLVLFGLPIIWLGPSLDVILSGGKGNTLAYLFDSGVSILYNFITFFGKNFEFGATLGIRFEIAVVLAGVGYLVYLSSKNYKKTFLAVILCYALLFIIGSLPGIIYTLKYFHGSSPDYTIGYITQLLYRSNLSHNTLNEGVVSNSLTKYVQLAFDKLLSQILFIFSFIFLGLYFWQTEKEKFKAVLKNARVERIIFYLVLLLLGVGYGVEKGYGHFLSWVDILTLICLMLSWSCVWLFAVQINDIFDIGTDQVSNPDRPLVNGDLTEAEMWKIAFIFLVISLLSSWFVSLYAFFMNLVFVALSYIYSSEPLRLKRVTILSSFIISLACLATVMGGFFFISANRDIRAFPLNLSFLIILIFTLGTNIRDIKDIEGDTKDGVKTLPVVFTKKGKEIVGVLLALSFLLIPTLLNLNRLYAASIPAAILGYYFVVKKNYREKYIFVLAFCFLILSVFIYTLK